MCALRAVVVEDEPLPRRELTRLLAQRDVEVVGEADSVASARKLLLATEPDVVFLDIQLGRSTAFDLLDHVDGAFDIVFVTAYDRYAVQAFQVAAIDYLLKPVDPARLDETITRLLEGSLGTPGAPRPEPTTDGTDGVVASETLSLHGRLFVKDRSRWRFVRVDSIAAIEADGDFTRVRLRDGPMLLLGTTMKRWEKTLPAASFARIHRSTIVNLEHVTDVEEWFNRTFRVHVAGISEPYPMSRRYAQRLRR